MSESKRAAESEEQLVSRAQEAVSHCRWVVGECAQKWTERYARGRTDADFANLIGLSADQVYQRRRVWETFAASRDDFKSLKWSHFYAALTWEDAVDSLRWAEETRSTVAEMRAWRRAQRGEDLSVDAVEEAIRFVPAEPEFVNDLADTEVGAVRGGARSATGAGDEPAAALAGVARQAGDNGDDYTPFRSGAATVPPREQPAEVAAGSGGGEPPSTEQLAKRLSHTLERFVKLMTPQFRREFRRLPEPVKERFTKAVDDLASHVAELS